MTKVPVGRAREEVGSGTEEGVGIHAESEGVEHGIIELD